MRWGAWIIAAWGVLLVTGFAQSNLPSSWWMRVGDVEVEGGITSDGCLPMIADRTINRSFYAEWTVTIMRRAASGRYFTFDTYQGANDYRPENTLPDNLDLCWWAGVVSIDLPDGDYRLHTLWKLKVDGGTREIRRTSQPFTLGVAS